MPDMTERPTPQQSDTDSKEQITRIQSLMKRLSGLDGSAKADILARLSSFAKTEIEEVGQDYGFLPHQPIEEEPKEPEQSKEPAKEDPKQFSGSSPSDHFKAALHHATWWAGHHDLDLKYGNPRNKEEAKKHQLLMLKHLAEAGREEGRDIKNKVSGDLIREGKINPSHHFAWGYTNDFGADLLNAAMQDKKNHTHIGGHETSKYGPSGVFHQRKTPVEDLRDSGEHEFDGFVSRVHPSEYKIERSPLKEARERLRNDGEA